MIENFSQNLVRLRMSKGISQKELAKEIGVSPQTISNIEKQVAYPTFSNLEKIAIYFNANSIDLFGTLNEQAFYKNVFLDGKLSDDLLKFMKCVLKFEKLINDEKALEILNRLDDNF